MLEIGHGVDPGIREHIQKDIPVMKLEGIEARLLHLLQALGRGQQLQLLDDFYLVHFHGDGFVFVKCNCRHCRAPPFKLLKIDLQVAGGKLDKAFEKKPHFLYVSHFIPPRVGIVCLKYTFSFLSSGKQKRPLCPKTQRASKNPRYHLSLPPARPYGTQSCPQRCIGRARHRLRPMGVRGAARDRNWDAASYLPCTGRQLSA